MRRRARQQVSRVIAFIALVAVAGALPVGRVQAEASTVPPCTPGAWDTQATPTFNRQLEMFGAFAASPSDVWAVGALFPESPDYVYEPLVLHFDGTSWTQVPVPLPEGSPSAMLRAVGGTSPSDVWVVGMSWTGDAYNPGDASALFEHWDGTSWSVVPAPPLPDEDVQLSDVTAVSPTDVWAVGVMSHPDPDNPDGTSIGRPLTEHWDGASWEVVPTPKHPRSNYDYFWAVSASSSSNVWALGQWYDEAASTWGNSIQRWDGASWSIVKDPFGDFPTPGAGATAFWNVAAVSPTDVWFAGYHVRTSNDLVPVVKRWDATSWQDTDVHAQGQLIDITASSSQDIWMLGTNPDSTSSFGQHWDGTVASAFPNPPSPQVNFQYGGSLTALPSGDVWAVGTRSGGSRDAYVQHLCPIPVSDAAGGTAGVAARTSTVGVSADARMGAGVAWKFKRQNSSRHRVVDASGMDLFDSGLRRRGGSYTRLFKTAGIYPWKDPTTGARGRVRVPISVSPQSGSKAIVKWSRAKPRPGYVFDVQVKKPGADKFISWKFGVVSTDATFSPARKGTYLFRARLRRPGEHAHSGWSPRARFQRT